MELYVMFISGFLAISPVPGLHIFTVHHSVQIDPRLGVAIVSKTPDVESGGSLECRNSELSYATQENCVSSCPDPFDMLGDHLGLWAKYTLSFPSCF